MGAILDVATGWTLYAGLITTLGACVGRWILIPRAGIERRKERSVLDDQAGRLGYRGALLLLPAMALFFVRQLLEFRDPFVPWTSDAELLLTGTAWGTAWLLGAAGAVATVVAFGAAARGIGAGWWLGTPAILALGAFPAFTGHASGADGPRALTLATDVLHVWAAGGWAGGLVFVLSGERRWRGPMGTGESLLPTLVPTFSPVAVACVSTLVATGVVGAIVHVPSLTALIGSTYGRTLLIKLVAVSAALALGFLNWRRLTPRLAGGGGEHALTRAATVELLVVQVVLVLTALLVRIPPSG